MDEGIPMSVLAAELVGIYREARSLEDEEYAADAIDDLLDAVEEDTDDEVLMALLDLPGTELTAPLVEDAVCMLADSGARVVERLLELVLARAEPVAPRAFRAFDRMDDDELAEGLFDVLAGSGQDHIRQLAADLLAALGHAGARRLQDAFEDSWTRDLARAAVEDRAGGLDDVAEPDGLPDADRPGARSPRGEEAADGGVGAVASSERSDTPEASVRRPPPPDPVGPAGDALEAEYRAFLERFERESGG